MQFITHGPDIPDALLRAHEEGPHGVFCGAGISYPAGLPGFNGLGRSTGLNGTALSDIERESNRGQFDATSDLPRAAPARPAFGRPPRAGSGTQTKVASQRRRRYAGGAVAVAQP